jgi:Domain of unknown function (DUF3883)
MTLLHPKRSEARDAPVVSQGRFGPMVRSPVVAQHLPPDNERGQLAFGDSFAMRVHDDRGRALDATVQLEPGVGGTRIVFESRGPDRNVDYVVAFDLVLRRLAILNAVLIDAAVVSAATRHLSLDERRVSVDTKPYPIRLTTPEQGESVARSLRSAATKVGREPGAGGGGNPTKRVELRFRVSEPRDLTISWLAEQLLWPAASVESLAVEEYVRPRSPAEGQGYGLDAQDRRLVEEYAMQRAIQYFSGGGAKVRDVSLTKCYDLLCVREGREFHVEVKGTTGLGRAVLLTRNEVEHAQDFPSVVLFVLSEVALTEVGDRKVATGGKQSVFDPWQIDSNRLEAQTYSLSLVR